MGLILNFKAVLLSDMLLS